LTDTFWHRTYCVEANRQRTSNFRSVQVNAAVLDNVDVETSHSAVPTADRDDFDHLLPLLVSSWMAWMGLSAGIHQIRKFDSGCGSHSRSAILISVIVLI